MPKKAVLLKLWDPSFDDLFRSPRLGPLSLGMFAINLLENNYDLRALKSLLCARRLRRARNVFLIGFRSDPPMSCFDLVDPDLKVMSFFGLPKKDHWMLRKKNDNRAVFLVWTETFEWKALCDWWNEWKANSAFRGTVLFCFRSRRRSAKQHEQELTLDATARVRYKTREEWMELPGPVLCCMDFKSRYTNVSLALPTDGEIVDSRSDCRLPSR